MATIQGIYVALFGRPADPGGLAYYMEATGDGADLSAIADFTYSAEYLERFEGQTPSQVVSSIFQSLFEREPDQDDLDYWLDEWESGRATLNNVAIRILDGAQGADRTNVEAKLAAADLFTGAIDTAGELAAYRGTSAADAARAFLSSVNASDPATIEEASAALAAIVPTVPTVPTQPGGGGGGAGPVVPGDGSKVIDFDDLPAGLGRDFNIPDGYEGFNWNNWGVRDPANPGGPSKYDVVVTSAPNVAYNQGAWLTWISRDEAFDAESFNIAAAWRDGLTVRVTGYLDNEKTGAVELVLNTREKLVVDLPDEFFDRVDTIRFMPIDPGVDTIEGADETYTNFGVDDIVLGDAKGPVPKLSVTDVPGLDGTWYPNLTDSGDALFGPRRGAEGGWTIDTLDLHTGHISQSLTVPTQYVGQWSSDFYGGSFVSGGTTLGQWSYLSAEGNYVGAGSTLPLISSDGSHMITVLNGQAQLRSTSNPAEILASHEVFGPISQGYSGDFLGTQYLTFIPLATGPEHAWSSVSDGGTDLYLLDMETGSYQNLSVDLSGDVRSQDASSAGNYVAFSMQTGNTVDLYVYDIFYNYAHDIGTIGQDSSFRVTDDGVVYILAGDRDAETGALSDQDMDTIYSYSVGTRTLIEYASDLGELDWLLNVSADGETMLLATKNNGQVLLERQWQDVA